MRLWAHVIWLKKNPGTALALCGPKEDRKLEYLIRQYGLDPDDPWGGEIRVAYGWYLYVNAKPAQYRLRPVKHVDKFTTAKGNIMAKTVLDTASITRFPLSAFLAVNDGFMIQACLHLDAFSKAVRQAKAEGKSDQKIYCMYASTALGLPGYQFEMEILPGMLATRDAVKQETSSIKKAWGVTQEDLENDVMDEF